MDTVTNEDIVDIMVDIPDDSTELEEQKLEAIHEIQEEIEETGGVNHQLAISLEAILPGCVTSRVPLASFTKNHTLTNKQVAVEGIGKAIKYVKTNILDKAVEIIKKLIEWLVNLFTKTAKGSDKTQKENIREEVKKSDKSEKKQKAETVREKDIAKKVSYKDELAKSLLDAIRKDMEGTGVTFNSTGSNVEKVFTGVRNYYANVGLKGKFSPFIKALTIDKDANALITGSKLQILLQEHISLVTIEIFALTKALDSSEDFPPRSGFLPYKRYNDVLDEFTGVKFKKPDDEGLATVTAFKTELYNYVAVNETIAVASFDDITWKTATPFFDSTAERVAKKFIEQVLAINNGVSKIQDKLKNEHDEATVEKYTPAVESIKSELAYITHIASINDILEAACGNFAKAYNNQVLRASKYFINVFNNKLKKMDIDNDLKDAIVEYTKAVDDDARSASLESCLNILDSITSNYLSSDVISNENFLDKVTDALVSLDKVTDALGSFTISAFTKLYDALKGKLTEQEVALKHGKKNAELLEKNTKDLLRIGKIYENRDTQREVVNAIKNLSQNKDAGNLLLGVILKPASTVYIRLFEEKFAKQQDIFFTPSLAFGSDFNFTEILKTVAKTDGATAQNRSHIKDMLAKSKKELTTKLILFAAYHDDGSKIDHSEIDDETGLFKAIKENMNFLLSSADEYYRIPDTKTLVGFIYHVTDIYKNLDIHIGGMKKALSNISKWDNMLKEVPETTRVPKETMDAVKEFVYTYTIMVKTSIFIVDSLLNAVNNIVDTLLTNSNEVIKACENV